MNARRDFAALAFAFAAYAAPALADSQYDACVNAAGSNVAFSRCGGDWIKREDARLNAAWKRVYPPLPAATKKALLTEQRQWIAYRGTRAASGTPAAIGGVRGRRSISPSAGQA